MHYCGLHLQWAIQPIPNVQLKGANELYYCGCNARGRGTFPLQFKGGSIKPLRSSLFSSPPRCEVRNISHQINCAKTLYSKLCLGKKQQTGIWCFGVVLIFLEFIVNAAVSGVFTPEKLFMGFQRGPERPGEAKIPV